ncbi:MAG TPA: hypothetical protein QGF02_01380 [Candidatus Babeliales bacterium]|nr:hypothetical protein [Candidatus Babeliales bacterium]
MNIKKVILTIFIGINIATIWCHQYEPEVTASMNIPASLVSRQSFDCVLASDFDHKVDCVKQGYVLLGSVRNPLFENTGKRDMRLLNNQKYGFIFYKVPTKNCLAISKDSKQQMLVDLPEQDLIKAIQSKRILINI